MRDRYNLNLLPGMSEDGVEYGIHTRTYIYIFIQDLSNTVIYMQIMKD